MRDEISSLAVQPGAVYTQALGGQMDGLRLSVVRKGFGWEDASEPGIIYRFTHKTHNLPNRSKRNLSRLAPVAK